jgi:Transglycosylase SLT domain
LFPKLLIGTAVSLSLTAPWLVSTQSDTSKHALISTHQTESRGPIVGTVPMVDMDEQYVIQQEVDSYLAALKAEEDRKVAEYLAAVEAQRQQEERARQASATSHQGSYNAPAPNGITVGDCTGFSIPSYIIQRESGGNPNAMNPSGAYGCAQTLLSHYSSGSCRGLDPYTIEGQRACVDILSNGGTNLSPWAQTR